jgi:hypothetical protein
MMAGNGVKESANTPTAFTHIESTEGLTIQASASQNYIFVNGFSGKAGHEPNASGDDGLAFRPNPESLLILDNKALSHGGNVKRRCTSIRSEV